MLTALVGLLADSVGLEIIGVAVVVLKLMLLAFYEGFVRR